MARWLSIVIAAGPFACVQEVAKDDARDIVGNSEGEPRDASPGDAAVRAGPRDAASAGKGVPGLPCTPVIDELSPPPRHGAQSLKVLCAELSRDGRIRCPRDRTEILLKLGEDCTQSWWPSLNRGCGLDVVHERVAEDDATWMFDSATGALVGASVMFERFVCGPDTGFYIAGQQARVCPQLVGCLLCPSGPERDAKCPAEVLELLPSIPCGEPTEACACPEGSGGEQEPGSLCDEPITCPSCYDGTCRSKCICMRDGQRRWNIECSD